jgi:IS5 family transposase
MWAWGFPDFHSEGGNLADAKSFLRASMRATPTPRQRDTREENEAIKRGQPPEDWEMKPDARWTKKHGKSFYGYKNHVNADAKHKLIRRYDVSDAAVHDSQKLDALLTKDNTSDAVFGDSAYRSAETEATLKAQGFKSRIHVRAARGHPLSKAKAEANRKKSRLRARVEHVFGAQQTSPGGRIVRTIGIVRARAKIGLQNLVYNIRRLVTLERMAAA